MDRAPALFIFSGSNKTEVGMVLDARDIYRAFAFLAKLDAII